MAVGTAQELIVVKFEVLTSYGDVIVNLGGVAFENLPVRPDGVTDGPHVAHERLSRGWEAEGLLPFPCIAVAAGGHPNDVAELVIGHDRHELVEVASAVRAEKDDERASEMDFGRVDDTVGIFREVSELEGNVVRVVLSSGEAE